MQEGSLPEGIDTTPVQILSPAGWVLAFGEIQSGEISFRLIRPGAGASESVHEEARDLERDVTHRLRIDAHTRLSGQEPVVRVALFELRIAGGGLTVGATGDDGMNDMLDVPSLCSLGIP